MTDEKRPQGYLEQTSNLTNSLILVAPVLVLYQVGLLLTDFAGFNGADFLTGFVLRQGGKSGLLLFNLAVLIGIMVAAARRERSLSPGVVGPMMIECALYALSLGFIINQIMRRLPLGPPEKLDPLTGVVASLGAGVNEELFFRLLLVQGVAAVLGGSSGPRRPVALTVATVASSIIFSAAHHLGSQGDPWSLQVFVFRFLAGVIFAGLFLARGLGVAVYTHAFYDIFVIVYLGNG